MPPAKVKLRRRASSLPSLLSIGSGSVGSSQASPTHQWNERNGKVPLSATSSVDSSYRKQPSLLTPYEYNKPKSRTSSVTSNASNTISVHAESVSAVSIKTNERSPKGSITSKTSISLKINSPAGEINTSATCAAKCNLDCKHTKTKMSTSARFNIPSRKSSSVSHSTVSTDYDMSSDQMYGSIFDLRNADKYYVSGTPTWFQRFRMYCKRSSESTNTAHAIMVVIILNTICMGLEHHNQVGSY